MVISRRRPIYINYLVLWLRGIDHCVFFKNTSKGSVLLAIYVDDIVLTGNDVKGIQEVKANICKEIKTKDLELLIYFLSIEIFQSKYGIILSQRKYVFDLLEDTWMMGCRPADTPMDSNTLLCSSSDKYVDVGKYQRLLANSSIIQ
ncbi:uncharacterized mitochondrial protein AtMg00810-like [Aristolochia californica]|uniref:uncharacterized mitochondrial protein AtMg00810-like n=1 Tax=Aristolochia californica TaxID=171875 RepID=UPI0035DC937D